MERMNDTPNTIEVFENDIEVYLNEFCAEQMISDLRAVPQSVWNGALRYVYRKVFKNNKSALKQHNNLYVDNMLTATNCNAYDYDLVNDICDYYIYLCQIYNKEVSIMGFSALTGIDTENIHNWSNDNNKYNNIYNNNLNIINNNPNSGYSGNKLRTTGFDVYKKLNEMREESLSNKLADGKQNPVGVIAMLNRHYGWASPYTSDANKRSKAALGNAELPKLGENTQQIAIIDSKNVIDSSNCTKGNKCE